MSSNKDNINQQEQEDEVWLDALIRAVAKIKQEREDVKQGLQE